MTCDTPDQPRDTQRSDGPAGTSAVTSASGEVAGIRWKAATRAGGSRPNQDRYLATSTATGVLAAVIDGATTVSNASPNGGDYAETLARALAQAAAAGLTEPAEILRTAIRDTRDGLRLPGPTAPSATVALIHVTDDRIEALALGDCVVVLLSDARDDAATGAPVVVTDTREKAIAADLRTAYRQRLAAGSGFDETHADLLARIRDTERHQRNTPDGYPTVADDPDAADHAVTRATPRVAVTHVIVASDGAADGPDRYGTPEGWAATLQSTPAHVILDTHAAEAADPDGQRWPRSKRHDDKTLMVLDLSRGHTGGTRRRPALATDDNR